MVRQKKLQEKKDGPYKIVKVQPKIVTVKKDSTFDTVSTNKISIVQRKNETSLSSPEYRQKNKTDGIRPTQAESHTNTHNNKEREIDTERFGSNGNQENESVVDLTVDHTVKRGRTLYRVRWYGYAASDDTVKPAKNIRGYFIRRY